MSKRANNAKTHSSAAPLLRSRLRHRRDWQSLAYLILWPALAIYQWIFGLTLWFYLPMLFLSIGVGVIHHNHGHLPMWTSRALNRATDLWITLLQGHPSFAFEAAHVGNHHRYRHGANDVARTYRFGGDTNNLSGWLLHPLQAIGVVYPLLFGWLQLIRRRSAAKFRWCMLQYLVWIGSWLILLMIDPIKAIVFVIGPQLLGLHWLLAANYLQHAHADGTSTINYARNFEGVVNLLLFNIGLHTAHHEHARAHWSSLPRLHRELAPRIDSRLIEADFFAYVWRVFVLGTFVARYRSQSLMPQAVLASTPSTESFR